MTVLLLAFISFASAASQEPIPLPGGKSPEKTRKKLDWDINGYYENTFNAEYLRPKGRLSSTNAARGKLNLSAKYGGLLDFGLSAVGIGYMGRTRIDTAQYFPRELQNSILPPDPETGFPGTRDLFTYSLDNRLYLQEAFGTVYLPHFRMRAGRHKFYSGTGYAFNPIDLFNRKNPLDPTYEVDGLDAIWAALELPGQTELQFVTRFTHHISNLDYQVRLKTYARGWDFGLQYTRSLRERVDWGSLNTAEAVSTLANGTSLDAFVRGFRWNLVAGEFAGELGGVGVHGEGGYVFVEAPATTGTLLRAARNHERFLAGLDYTFDSQLYLLIEYMRLGQGVSESGAITLNDRMAFLSGETLAVGKDTVFSRISYPLTDLTELSLNSIVNTNDPSVLLNPWLLIDLHPRVKLSFAIYVPAGDDSSQLGNSGPGGFVRLKFHF